MTEEIVHQVFAVSDGTGGTAEQTIRAALTQYRKKVKIRRFGQVETVEEIKKIVSQASEARAIIVHTLVLADLRQAMFNEGRRRYVHTLDLMGPLLERLSDLLGAPPAGRPGLYSIDNPEEYSRRIEAMDFTFRHDDGQRVEDLEQAEIVLVGVSRTGKTPLGFYLGYRGWMVGNVPVLLGIEPPEVLFRLPRERVIGLTVRVERLIQLRKERERRMSGGTRDYANPERVRQEVKQALALFHHQGWRIVDMTFKSMEEAAAEVVALIGGGAVGKR